MADAKPMQVRCPFCGTLIPANATVCGYCERPTGLVVGVSQLDPPQRASRAPRVSARFIVGMLFGLICLALVVYGVYVMAQA